MGNELNITKLKATWSYDVERFYYLECFFIICISFQSTVSFYNEVIRATCS